MTIYPFYSKRMHMIWWIWIVHACLGLELSHFLILISLFSYFKGPPRGGPCFLVPFHFCSIFPCSLSFSLLQFPITYRPTTYQVLINLHWLPIDHRVIFKLPLYTYKALHGLAPDYLDYYTLNSLTLF